MDCRHDSSYIKGKYCMELKYNGLLKVAEECGELIQVAMKMSQFHMLDIAKQRKLVEDLHEEVADVLATLDYLIESKNMNTEFIAERRDAKLAKFHSYVDTNKVL